VFVEDSPWRNGTVVSLSLSAVSVALVYDSSWHAAARRRLPVVPVISWSCL